MSVARSNPVGKIVQNNKNAYAFAIGAGQPCQNEREQHLNAKEFLRNRLAGGPMAVMALIEEGKQHGISEDQLKRAKLGLPIKDYNDGGRLVWQLDPEL